MLFALIRFLRGLIPGFGLRGSRRRPGRRAARWLLPLLAAFLTNAVTAGAVLDRVKSAGVLRCGVSEGIAGFSERDAAGRWQGFDADFCRAVAAAVVGDGERVQFVPLTAAARFPALQAQRIDLLVRNTTWTLTREAVLRLHFPAVLLYDGQTFMVPSASGITQAGQLRGATVCLEKGTNHGRNLDFYNRRTGLDLKPMVLDSADATAAAFFAGRCAAYTGDGSQLAAVCARAPAGSGPFVLLTERIAEEPLAPVVWEGDPEWTTVVRWVLFALVIAEQEEITRENVTTRRENGSGVLARLSGDDKRLLGQSLGVPVGWVVRTVQAVGNYGEMFERNLGAQSPLHLERGPNRPWTDGGLMYAPPID